MKIITMMAITSALLAGCGTYPLAVPDENHPPTAVGPIDTAKKAPFSAVTDLATAAQYFMYYYRIYDHEAYVKRRNAMGASEVSFFSSIVGVIGGIAKSPETAIVGGLGAAGSGLYTDRYRLTVQATNYENAADAMRCMYFLTQDVAPLENDLKSRTYPNEGLTLDKVFLDVARRDFFKVHDKLRRLQVTFELGKPDVSLLSKAVQTKPPTVPGGGASLLSTTQTEQAGTYESSMEKCAALISG